MDKRKVLIAIPSFDKGEPATFKAIFDMHKPCECSFEYVKGYGVAKARNDIAKKAVKGGYDYVMMIDNDIVVPVDALERMLEGNADIVIACCPRKNTTTGQSVLFVDGKNFCDDNNINYSKLDELPDRVKLKGGGMGCALIKTKVFQILPFPWFEYVEYKNGTVLSEDLKFCINANMFLIEGDTRVRCGHIGSRIQYE